MIQLARGSKKPILIATLLAIVVGGLGIQLVRNTNSRSRVDQATFERLASEIVRKDGTIVRLEGQLELAQSNVLTLERRVAQLEGLVTGLGGKP